MFGVIGYSTNLVLPGVKYELTTGVSHV